MEKNKNLKEINLTTPEGVQISGWMANFTGFGPKPLLIFWGGNSEEVSGFILSSYQEFSNVILVAVNYRGFGKSTGQPSERALFADGLFVTDWARQLPNVAPNRVFLMGRSLGSGVAVHVASSEQPVAGVILVTPYDSIHAVAQKVYPLVPVKYLLKHPFDSLSHAPTLHIPMLAMIAAEDTIIPNHHSEKLFIAWAGPKEKVLLAGVGHNDVVDHPDFFPAIRTFIDHTPPR